eukprot:Lithocolla_globosa_v1_NODE_526_length_3808_cov_6.745004.p3 type:complete len:125 gc:universal NODE_526_length_3808_cov_6.745004:464-90(-)
MEKIAQPTLIAFPPLFPHLNPFLLPSQPVDQVQDRRDHEAPHFQADPRMPLPQSLLEVIYTNVHNLVDILANPSCTKNLLLLFPLTDLHNNLLPNQTLLSHFVLTVHNRIQISTQLAVKQKQTQ